HVQPICVSPRKNQPAIFGGTHLATADLNGTCRQDPETCGIPTLRFAPDAQQQQIVHNANRRKLLIGLAPQPGLEPGTLRLTAGCSTIELLRNSERRTALEDPLF